MRLPKRRARSLCAWCGRPARIAQGGVYAEVVDPRDERRRLSVCAADESRYYRILRETGERPLDLPNRTRKLSPEEVQRGIDLVVQRGGACAKAWVEFNRVRVRRGESPVSIQTFSARCCRRAGYIMLE